MDNSSFILYWRDGTKETVNGPSISDAVQMAGIGSLHGLDFWCPDDGRKFEYDASESAWLAVS